jgi:hypothetical protein
MNWIVTMDFEALSTDELIRIAESPFRSPLLEENRPTGEEPDFSPPPERLIKKNVNISESRDYPSGAAFSLSVRGRSIEEVGEFTDVLLWDDSTAYASPPQIWLPFKAEFKKFL